MDNRYSEDISRWHLRFGLTSRCNFRCAYCLVPGEQQVKVEPPLKEVVEVLQAAASIGIRRVHYTGGEPTLRTDFLKILTAARDIGFSQQILTTNGSLIHHFLNEAIQAGLTRIIISLDTLDENRNFIVTRARHFNDALKSIERSVALLPTLTKISCCTMRSSLPEIPAMVKYASQLNRIGYIGQLAIKLNQFFPCNPAQLDTNGADYWRSEFVEEQAIMETLRSIGSLRDVRREIIEGDNPSYRYYDVGDTGVFVAVLAMFSWDYPCGDCWKLRISPQGLATICINQKPAPNLWGKTLEEKVELLQQLISYRQSFKFQKDYRNRKHYRAQLGELRFDRVVGEERSIDFYKSLLHYEV